MDPLKFTNRNEDPNLFDNREERMPEVLSALETSMQGYLRTLVIGSVLSLTERVEKIA